MVLLLLALIGVFTLGIIVFGGGQVFMPLFKSLWQLLETKGMKINDEVIENIFTVANSTPGVISTKFAVFTGYLVANGAWWGWIALILTYLIFALPSIAMIYYAYHMINKIDKFNHLKKAIIYLKPVIIGIILSLALQLLLGTLFPSLIFNGIDKYIKTVNNEKTQFFSGWRYYCLIFYVLFVICESFILYQKKINLFWLIIFHIALGMVVFQPWI